MVTRAGDGRVPFVSAGDIAATALAAFESVEPLSDEVVPTGPDLLSYDDGALMIGTAIGRPIEHVSVTA